MQWTQEEKEKLLEGPNQEERIMLDALPYPPADERFVEFYEVTRRNDEKSAKEGRPIHEPRTYVRIFTAGDKDNLVERPIRPLDRHFWPKKWHAYVQGHSQESAGTPLAVVGLPPERIADLAHFKIRTAEDYARVTDGNLQSLGPGARTERQKCIDFVAASNGSAPVAELRAENDALKARLEALEKLAQGFAGTSVAPHLDPVQEIVAVNEKPKRGPKAKRVAAE